jgi:hypothetical protein
VVPLGTTWTIHCLGVSVKLVALQVPVVVILLMAVGVTVVTWVVVTGPAVTTGSASCYCSGTDRPATRGCSLSLQQYCFLSHKEVASGYMLIPVVLTFLLAVLVSYSAP